MSKETIQELQIHIQWTEKKLEEAKEKNYQELINVLNHDLRKYRRAIKNLQAGA